MISDDLAEELNRGWRRRRREQGAASIDSVCARDVVPERINWLWEGRLALGKITLLGGYPDVGKTLLGLDCGARITRPDARWPTGEIAPTGEMIILSAEDAPEDTIRPRLEAAEAMLDSVRIIKAAVDETGRRRTFSLQRDLDALDALLSTMTFPRYLMIDPVTSYLGEIDSHRTTDVRAALEPLATFASERRIAVMAITHPPKASQANAINNFTGSLAFVAAPRLAFVAVKEPNTDRKLLLPVKNNIGALVQGRGYYISTKQISNGIIAPCILWDDAPVDVTANEAIFEASQADKPIKKRDAACEFLKAILSAGPRDSEEVKSAAGKSDISEITLRRARERLGVVYGHAGFPARTTWALP